MNALQSHMHFSFSSISSSNIVFSETFKTKINSNNSTKGPKNSTDVRIISKTKTNSHRTNETSNSQTNYLMTSENRNTLSGLLLFPSRPKPMLRPKLSNGTINCTKRSDKNNCTQRSNNSSNGRTDSLERRDDNHYLSSVSKASDFGYRKKSKTDTNIDWSLKKSNSTENESEGMANESLMKESYDWPTSLRIQTFSMSVMN